MTIFFFSVLFSANELPLKRTVVLPSPPGEPRPFSRPPSELEAGLPRYSLADLFPLFFVFFFFLLVFFGFSQPMLLPFSRRLPCFPQKPFLPFFPMSPVFPSPPTWSGSAAPNKFSKRNSMLLFGDFVPPRNFRSSPSTASSSIGLGSTYSP